MYIYGYECVNVFVYLSGPGVQKLFSHVFMYDAVELFELISLPPSDIPFSVTNAPYTLLPTLPFPFPPPRPRDTAATVYGGTTCKSSPPPLPLLTVTLTLVFPLLLSL